MRTVANVSWGKDSTAMVLRLLDEGTLPDAVVFCDTGMEFNCVYSVRDMVLPKLYEAGVEYIEVHEYRPMWYEMCLKPIHARDGSVRYGYGWCGNICRWGTARKNKALEKLMRRFDVKLVGIAADEPKRMKLGTDERYPLAAWGMTEEDCLAYCRSLGVDWVEDGVRLYDVLDRVSCWCCSNKNKKELRAMRDNLPKYYEMLLGLERAFGPMKKPKTIEEAVA